MLIICNGMLRSGSTLQYNLAAEVMSLHRPVLRAGFMGGLEDKAVRARLAAMRDSDDWHIVKTHDAPLDPGFYTARVKALFSRRDPRDVAASIRKKWNKPFRDILSDVTHMLRIEEQTSSVPGVLIQEYRDLYEDLPGCVARLGQFLSVPMTPQAIARIADDHAVEQVAGRISRRRSDPFVSALRAIAGRFRIDPVTMMHDDHISASAGRDGDWRNCFSAEELEILHAACAGLPPSPSAAAA